MSIQPVQPGHGEQKITAARLTRDAYLYIRGLPAWMLIHSWVIGSIVGAGEGVMGGVDRVWGWYGVWQGWGGGRRVDGGRPRPACCCPGRARGGSPVKSCER